MKEMNKKGGRNENRNNNMNQGNNNSVGVPVTKIIDERKKYTAQETRLKNMKWGMGLEHEAQYFYIPSTSTSRYKLDSIVIFNSLDPLTELLDDTKYNLTEYDRNILLSILYEKTGRKCHGKMVLEKTPVTMPEFITDNPFSSLQNPKNIHNYFLQLRERERRFYELMHMHKGVSEFLFKNELDIGQYPFGMCSKIQVRKDYDGDSWVLDKKEYVDYCGSFHYTITLPYPEKEKYTEEDEKTFVDRHYNFGAMLQWIEPLLLSAYFSCDQEAVGTLEKKIRGSFRVARVGWGNFAGSDMRKKGEGVGRYADVWPYWREDFRFYESDVTKSCFPPNPKLKEPQAVSAFSSNIRTFGPNPENPKERFSGAPMKIPNGVEIRIFDHFETQNLYSLLQIILLIAANSTTTTVKDYVYEDKDWIETLQKIMVEGWKATVSPVFLQKLENVYQISVPEIKSYKAYDVLVAIVKELYKKNRENDIIFLMYGKNKEPRIPQINRYSWEMAFMLKIVNDKKVYEKYIKFLTEILKKDKVDDFLDAVIKVFGKEWKNNREDILYFMLGKSLIELVDNGKKYKVNADNIEQFHKLEEIKTEIRIQLMLDEPIFSKNNNNNLKFFSHNSIKKRFQDLLYIDEDFLIPVIVRKKTK